MDFAKEDIDMTPLPPIPAWAIRVDFVELCARLEALHESRIQIDHFDALFGHKLPAEIMSNISQALFHETYLTKRVYWAELRRCCHGICDLWRHLPEEEYQAAWDMEYQLEAMRHSPQAYDEEHCDLEDLQLGLTIEAKLAHFEELRYKINGLTGFGNSDACFGMDMDLGVHPHLQVVEYEEEDSDDVNGFFSSQANLLVGRVDLRGFLMIRASDSHDSQAYMKISQEERKRRGVALPFIRALKAMGLGMDGMPTDATERAIFEQDAVDELGPPTDDDEYLDGGPLFIGQPTPASICLERSKLTYVDSLDWENSVTRSKADVDLEDMDI